tara:strand:- start:10357 stop:10686 length:330 start_codon:yes stop_codon:yes gene_type:complete
MTRLTSRQKELFQEDKYVLVDTIIILEEKLRRLNEELQFSKNELLLEGEAHIKAQEEIDDKDVDYIAMKDIEKHLDKAWDGEITSQNFVDTVTKIFTGDYYAKDSEKNT